MGMRLGCLLPLVSIALIIGGGQSVYTGFKNRKITEIELASLMEKKPDTEWLRIQGGVLDTMNSVYPSRFGSKKATSMYVPLVLPDTDSSEGQIHALVLTKDQALLDFTNEIREMEESDIEEAELQMFILKNIDKIRVSRPVEGVVQFGIEADDKKSRKINDLYGNIADDAIIIEEGKKPSASEGVIMLTGGLILGGFLLRRSARRESQPAAGDPPPLPPQ